MGVEINRPWTTNQFDGIIDYLGKDKNVSGTFQNPDTVRGYVDATQSSDQSGSLTADKALDQLTATASNRSHTTSMEGPWWMIDFGPDNAVALERFGIKGQASSGNHPRYFVILGANADGIWHELAYADNAGPTNNAWWSVAITDPTAYRYIKILGTRNPMDSSSNSYLVLGDVEMWGDYHDAATAAADPVFVAGTGRGWRGLFEWLGQNKTMGAWAHPETSRALITTSMSAVLATHTSHGALDHGFATTSHSENTEGSWWKVDLGSGNLFRLDAVALFGRSLYNPRNWKIEGSLDDSAWDELYDVPDGSTGPTDDTWSVYEMDTATAGYRYFRLTQYGPNSTPGTLEDYLAFDSIEFYGEWDVEAAGPPPSGTDLPYWAHAGYAFGVWAVPPDSGTAEDPEPVDLTDHVKVLVIDRPTSTQDRPTVTTCYIELESNDGDLSPMTSHVFNDRPWVAPGHTLWVNIGTGTDVTFYGYIDEVQELLPYIRSRARSQVVGITARDPTTRLARAHLERAAPSTPPEGDGDTMADRAERVLTGAGFAALDWPVQDDGNARLLLDALMEGPAMNLITQAAISTGNVFYFNRAGLPTVLDPTTLTPALYVYVNPDGAAPATPGGEAEAFVRGATIRHGMGRLVNQVDAQGGPSDDRWNITVEDTDSITKYGLHSVRLDGLNAEGSVSGGGLDTVATLESYLAPEPLPEVEDLIIPLLTPDNLTADLKTWVHETLDVGVPIVLHIYPEGASGYGDTYDLYVLGYRIAAGTQGLELTLRVGRAFPWLSGEASTRGAFARADHTHA